MANERANGLYALTAPVTLLFPALVTPRKYKVRGKETGEAKYGASFLVASDHPDLKPMKDHAIALAKAKWPGRDLGADVKGGSFKLPWTSGDVMIARDNAKLQRENKPTSDRNAFMAGKVVFKASSKFPAVLSLLENGRMIENLQGAALEAAAGKFYFGCEVLAEFNFQPYDRVKEEDQDGVTCYLQQVVSLNKGTRLGGQIRSASDTFKGYVGASTLEDPTGEDEQF